MRVNTNNTFLLTLLLSATGSTCAVPPAAPPAEAPPAPSQDAPAGITEQQILKVAPQSATCDNPPAAGECATAKDAAGPIAASFEKYKVTSPAEQAAVIGLMAMESGGFKYHKKIGEVGIGTRNMQSVEFNAEYAASIGEIAGEVAKANGDAGQILDLLVAKPEYDFGSGAWFLTTQCEEGVREALQSGSEEGWTQYITECVQTEANDERRGYWQSAKAALMQRG